MDLAGMKRRELQALCKRQGLPAGGTNAALVARLDAALSGAAGAEEVVGVPAAKGCLKQTGGDAAEAKKVTFAAEEGRARRLRTRVIWSPIVDKAKPRGKSAQASTDSAAAAVDGVSAEVVANVPVRRSRRKSVVAVEAEEVREIVAAAEDGVSAEVVANVPVRRSRRKSVVAVEAEEVREIAAAAEDGVSAEVVANVPVRRSRRKSVSAAEDEEIGEAVAVGRKRKGKSAQASTDSAAAEDSVSAEVGTNVPVRQSRRKSVIAAEAEKVGEAGAVDRKRKRKNQDNDDGAVAVGAQDIVSSRVTRRSSLAGVALVLPPAVEKKRGRGKTAGANSKLADVAQDFEPDLWNSAQVEASPRITRSRRSIAPAVISPSVVENKRMRKTGDARSNVELPTVSDVPRNEAPVTRSLRNRAVQVNNSMVGETHTASQLESKTQPSRQPTRKHQQVSSSVEDKKQEQVAAPNKAPVLRRSGRNCSEDAEKQPVVKEPVKRSTRKSVVPATLEKEENVLIEEKNPAAHVRRSTRKSVVPVKDIKGIGEKIHNANREDAVKQPATKGPVRGSRHKSVVPELHEKEKGLIAEKDMEAHEGKSKKEPVMPVKDIKAVGEGIQNAKGKDVEKQIVVKQPTRRSSRKSVMPDMLEKNNGLLAEEINAEMNVRRSTRKSVKDIPNEEDNTGGRSSKRRRTTASEEVRSVKANDDIIIREATKDARKATHEYKESGSRVQGSGQVNVTREEHSLGPLLVTVTLPDKISTVQSVPVVIHGSESGDNTNESSDKSKQEHSNIQAVDSHLSEKIAELDQSSCISRLVLHNFDVSEDKSLMSKDGLSIDFTVGDREVQSPVSGEGRLGMEANASEPGEKNLANVKSTGLHTKILQHDTDIIAKENDKDVLPLAFPIEEHGEKYTGTPVAVEKIVGWEASACLQHDCDVLTKETGEAFGAAPPISEDTNQEILCNAGESIQAADLGKCPSRGSIGNPYLEGAADDKGCSSDGRPSSFGVDLMLAEACKESFSKNTENTAVEIVDGNKHSTPVTPGFYVESVCLEDEDVQPSGCDADADENFNVDQGIAGEEVLAQEKSNDQHVPAKTEQNMKLNDELAGSGTESGLQKANLDEERVLSVFSLNAKHIEVINSEEVASEGEGSKKLVHSEDLKASFEETDFNGPASGAAPPISEDTNPEIQCNAEESIRAADLGKCPSRVSKGNPYSTSLHLEGAAADCNLPVLNSDKRCSSEGRPSSFGLELMFAEVCKESYSKSVENTVGDCEEQSPVSGEGTVGLEANASESGEKNPADIMSTGLYTETLQHDTDILAEETDKVAEESIRAADLGKCPSRCSKGNPLSTNLHVEGSADDTSLPVLNADKGYSSGGRPSAFGLELMFAEECEESYSRNAENNAVEIDAGSKPSTPVTSGFHVHVEGAADDTSLPILNADKGYSSDGRPSAFGLELMFAEECEESYSRNAENNAVEIDGGSKPSTPVTSGFHVQSDCLEDEDVQPTECDADNKRDVDEGLAEEDFAQEKSNDQHVPAKTDLNMKLNNELAGPGAECITEQNARLVADNLDEQAIILVQQGDVQEGDLKKPSPCSTTPVCKHKFGLPEETVLPPKNTGSLSGAEQSPFCLESLFSHENTDESMGSATAHTKNGFNDSKDCHVNSGLENTHVSKPYSLNDIVDGISKNDDCMQTSQHDNGTEGLPEVLYGSSMEKSLDGLSTCGVKIVCRVDAIENPSICLATTGYKHEDALSEEAEHALKDYAGTCSSNPRELLMDLQSLFSKGNIKESHPDDGLTFPSAENSGDQSIRVEQRVKALHGSNLSHLGSTDLLDELIGCSNTQVLHQSHNHEDRSNMDRVEQVASEPCTSDIVEAAAAECIESGLVLLPSEERSNLNDGQLNPKLESPTNMGSGLNCDKYVCNTSANGSAVVVVGERTPSGSGLPEDYPKDHYPRQELLDGCSVESSQGTIRRKKIVSAVVGIGSPSSLATHDYKYEGALSKESVCRMKNYTGMSSVDPKHLIMEMQSPHSEGSTEKPDLQDNLAFKYEGALSKEAVCRMKNYTGMSSVDPKHLIMEMQSPHSEGSTEKPDLQDNLAFPHALNARDELVICHVEELLAPHVSSEPDTYQRPCEDLSRHEEKESCMKGSLTSVQIDLADDAHLIERDIVAPMEVSCEEKVEMKSYSNGHGICQSHSQKHIVEVNFRLSSCGTGTEVIHQDHKEECNEPNEGKFSPKALVENDMSEDAPIEGIMLPLVAGTSGIHDEQLNTKMSDENEEVCFSSDKDTIENFCTGPAKGDLYSLPKDFHIEICQKQEVPEVISLPESAEESAKFQCMGVSGSGPCQQRVNESTSMQPTYNIETINLDHECNQNNEDQTTPGDSASSVPETVEIEIEQSEMEIGLIPATETAELPVPDEQPNSKLEGNGVQITPGIPTSSVPEAVEIEQSEMEIGLISAAETSVLPVPDEQPNSKLERNEVDEHNCSYDKDFFILSDSKSLKTEASSLNKDDCKDMSSEDNHPNDLPAPRSPEPSAYIQKDNELGSVGISQSSRRSGISELRAKLQSFKVSSTVKGSYIAMGAPRPKPGDSMSQSAVALLRNIENTPAVKAGHHVKTNADGKDSSRRALQPISGRPREH